MKTFNIAIVGATGYTGSELVRLLLQHPHVRIHTITSESSAGKPFPEVHPQFAGLAETNLVPMDDLDPAEVDAIFLALPHGVAMAQVQAFAGCGKPIIDLSGDFRLNDAATYTEWYGMAHSYPEGFAGAVYGLPEWNRDAISKAGLIANPGCFPTGALLALLPLLKAGWIETDRIIIDSKTGVTGAGVKASATTHFSNVHDNFKPYGLKRHRHTIEMEQQAGQIAGALPTVQFTPHLLPVDRGILTTLYARPKSDVTAELLDHLYRDTYTGAPFVRLLKAPPQIKHVRGSNFADLYTDYDERTGNILVISAIDNLVKGAAGQAIQNMNLRLGLPETEGLMQVPLTP